MNIYEVPWKIPRGGAYVPPDPVCLSLDGHYADLHGKDIITTRTAKIAKAAVEAARPEAKVQRPKMICPAE